QELVEVFYRKMLSDDRVSAFFVDVDMGKQLAKQRACLTMVAGAPNSYTGKDMRRADEHLLERGLHDPHVDGVIEHRGASLAELGAPADIIATVKSVAEGARADVLNR